MAIVKLANVRLSFPDIWEPKQFDGAGPFRYRASFLQPEGQKVYIREPDGSWKPSTMAEILKAVAAETWKAKGAAVLESLRGNSQKCCWYDGASKDYDGYDGNFVLSASRDQTKGRPIISDRDASPLSEKDGKPYAGCYVNASVELWAQDNKFGKGLRATLRAIQFFADGDAFAAGTPVTDDELGALDAPEGVDDVL